MAKKQPNHKPVATEPIGTVEHSPVGMDVVSEYVFPEYTDKEILMDDSSVSFIEFMSCFATFKADELSIDNGKDDVVFNAKQNDEETNIVNLSGLKYDKEECKNNWTKRKETY